MELEFQVYHPAYLTVREELGIAHKEADQIQGREMREGDNRLPVPVALAWEDGPSFFLRKKTRV